MLNHKNELVFVKVLIHQNEKVTLENVLCGVERVIRGIVVLSINELKCWTVV